MRAEPTQTSAELRQGERNGDLIEKERKIARGYCWAWLCLVRLARERRKNGIRLRVGRLVG